MSDEAEANEGRHEKSRRASNRCRGSRRPLDETRLESHPPTQSEQYSDANNHVHHDVRGTPRREVEPALHIEHTFWMIHRGLVIPLLVEVATTPTRYAQWTLATLVRHTITACRQVQDEGQAEGWW